MQTLQLYKVVSVICFHQCVLTDRNYAAMLTVNKMLTLDNIGINVVLNGILVFTNILLDVSKPPNHLMATVPHCLKPIYLIVSEFNTIN